VENVDGEGNYKMFPFEISVSFIIIFLQLGYRLSVKFFYTVISTWRSLMHFEVRAAIEKQDKV
jgi:hypothetical protein